MTRTAAILATLLLLAACGGGEPSLFNARSPDRTPDEFAIVPSRPLETPPTLASLPPPTPGGTNRTDRAPRADAIAALGGRPGAGAPADGALVGAVGRYGVAGDIRSRLAAEDLAFRRDNAGRPLDRLLNRNTYFRAYAPLSLDQHAELRRLRQAGVRTVAAPPDPAAR